MPARFWQRSLACVLFLVAAGSHVLAQPASSALQPPEQPSPPDPPPPTDVGFRFHGYLR